MKRESWPASQMSRVLLANGLCSMSGSELHSVTFVRLLSSGLKLLPCERDHQGAGPKCVKWSTGLMVEATVAVTVVALSQLLSQIALCFVA